MEGGARRGFRSQKKGMLFRIQEELVRGGGEPRWGRGKGFGMELGNNLLEGARLPAECRSLPPSLYITSISLVLYIST